MLRIMTKTIPIVFFIEIQNDCDHFDSSLFCNFIYRDRRQSSPLPQQIKPEAGKGHPIQSSDLLHTFLSVSLGGAAYRRRSGVILFLQHGAAMPVPFLMTVPFFFLPSEKQKSRTSWSSCSKMSGSNLFDNFLKTPIKKRCPFRKFHENSKKAPQIKLYIELPSCIDKVPPVIMRDASMEIKKCVLTFLLVFGYFLCSKIVRSKRKHFRWQLF